MNAPTQFHLFQDEAGNWLWRLTGAGNGYPIAICGEPYFRKEDAIHGARLIARIARDAAIWNEASKCWEP